MNVWTLIGCLTLLTLTNCPTSVDSSRAEVSQDEKTGELIVSVESSRPETTFSGRIGIRTSLGYTTRFQMDLVANEEFCFYTAILGMRNFSGIMMAKRYWDIDAEIEISNSEGEIISTEKLNASGKQMPRAMMSLKNIQRPDILQICIRNSGSAKMLMVFLILSDQASAENFGARLDSLDKTYNLSTDAISQLDALFAKILLENERPLAMVTQDFFRLMNIKSWVMIRGISSSAAMILCSGMSTYIIRRWFGSPRSTI